MPVKKRTNRNVLLLVGSIIVLVLIVGGIIVGLRVLNKGPSTPTATPTTAPRLTPTPTPRRAEQRTAAPAALESQMLFVSEGTQGYTHVGISSTNGVVLSLRSAATDTV
jgi:hypothetical protein